MAGAPANRFAEIMASLGCHVEVRPEAPDLATPPPVSDSLHLSVQAARALCFTSRTTDQTSANSAMSGAMKRQTDEQGNRTTISGLAGSLAAAQSVSIAWETRVPKTSRREQQQKGRPGTEISQTAINGAGADNTANRTII